MLTAQALPAPAPRAPAPVEALRLEAIGLILKASPLKLQSVLIALKGAPGAAGKKSKATPG